MDTWFYWSHRALHLRQLYWIHKQHHRFTTPVGVSAVFAHPIEDALVNLPSTFIGPVLVHNDAHFLTLLIYLALRFNETIDAHSGFMLPSLWRMPPLSWLHGGAERHDWHHSHQLGNYGGF